MRFREELAAPAPELSDEAGRAAAELAQTLRVSPAAVSNVLRYLQQAGLVAREREPGEQRDH